MDLGRSPLRHPLRPKGIAQADRAAAREEFFAKGQPCLRTSPLAKTYGWSFHYDANSRIALIPTGGERYTALVEDPSITVTPAMRSSR